MIVYMVFGCQESEGPWSRTHAGLPHLEVGYGCHVGEENAQNHQSVPNLVTVAANVVLSWSVPLWASHHVDVDSSQIRSSEQGDVGD